jgi:hypothetical protein
VIYFPIYFEIQSTFIYFVLQSDITKGQFVPGFPCKVKTGENKQKRMMTNRKRLFGIMLVAALLLMIPFIAMLFTSEVKWGLLDFAVAALLLFGTGLLCEWVLRKVKKTSHRIILCGLLLLALLLVWAELAVGIFGTPFAGS